MKIVEKFEKKLCNSLFWSPTGQFILLASLRSANYTLEFVDTSDFSRTNTQEHFKLSDVEWDPTGRFVVTSVSYWTNKVSFFLSLLMFFFSTQSKLSFPYIRAIMPIGFGHFKVVLFVNKYWNVYVNFHGVQDHQHC